MKRGLTITFQWLMMVSIFFGCQSGEERTGNEGANVSALGTDVTFVRKGDSLLESNKILLMNFRYATDSGVVMNESRAGEPLAMLFTRDTTGQNGQFQSVLNMLSIGDSVTFTIPAKDLFENTFRQTVPPGMSPETGLDFNIGVIRQMTQVEYKAYNDERIAAYNSARLEEEKIIIQNYLEEQQVQAKVTESGLHYVITKEGSGPKPKEGQRVNVRYKGTLLEGGTQFDAGDYAFVLGRGSVIAGWDEGIGYLNVGAKAVLYIPSILGYQRRGSGGVIPPDAPLVFEVELLEIN